MPRLDRCGRNEKLAVPRKAEYAIGRTTMVTYDYKTRSAAKISGKLKGELTKRVEAPVKFRETGQSPPKKVTAILTHRRILTS